MKKIVLILMILAILIFLGCAKYNEYYFDGQIDGERVAFWEDYSASDAYLEIKKPDGTKIEYYDYRRNLKIDSIRIILPNGRKTSYYSSSENPLVKEIISEGQKKFDAYLAKIHEINSAPLSK